MTASGYFKVLTGGLVLAMALAVVVLIMAPGALPLNGMGLAMVGAALALALLVLGLSGPQRRRAAMSALLDDPAPAFVTDAQGGDVRANPAGLAALSALAMPSDANKALVALLRRHFADPAAVMARMTSLARIGGTASEDIVTAQSHMRVTVQVVGVDTLVWRIADLTPPEPDMDSPGSEAIPRVTLDVEGRVLAQNRAMTALVGTDLLHLTRLIGDQPLRHGSDLQIATPHGRAMRTAVLRAMPEGRRELYLFSPPSSVRRPIRPHSRRCRWR